MRENISFDKGLVRNPSLGEAGECTELVNLIPNGGELVNISDAKQVQGTIPDGCRIIYVHTTSIFRHIVYINGNTNELRWFIQGEQDDLKDDEGNDPFLINLDKEQFVSITSVGIYLLIATENNTHYTRWSNGKYIDLGTSIPIPQIRFWTERQEPERLYLHAPTKGDFHAFNSGNTVQLPEGYVIRSDHQNDKINEGIAEVGSYLLEKRNSKTNNENVFFYPMFIRYVVKAFDGSVLYVSSPVFLKEAWAPFGLIHAMSKDNYVGSFPYQIGYFDGCMTSYKVRSEILNKKEIAEAYSKWGDFISDIEIYLSSPITSMDESKHFFQEPDWASTQDFQNLYGVYYDGDKPDLYNNTADIRIEEVKFYSVFAAHYASTFNENIKNALANFHKAGSISVFGSSSDIVWMSNLVNYMSNTPLGVINSDSVSSHYTYSYLTTFNQRMLAIRSKAIISNDILPSASTLTEFQISSNARGNAFICIPNKEAEADDYILKLKQEETGGSPISDYEIAYLAVNTEALWLYIDKRMFYLTQNSVSGLYEYNGIRATTKKESNGIQRLTIEINPIYPEGSPSANTDKIIKAIAQGDIVISEVLNPTVISSRATPGSGKLLAVAINAQPVSTGQFGQFPIIAFTSDGIHPISIDEKGDIYSNSAPLGFSTCCNTDALCYGYNTLYFPTQEGLTRINGNVLECISNNMIGQIIDRDSFISIAKTWMGSDFMQHDNLSDFLESCRGIVYDESNQLLIMIPGTFDSCDDIVVPDEPGTDEPGTDEPGTDEPGTDEPGTDEPGTDEPGTDEPGTDEPGTDEIPEISDEPEMDLEDCQTILDLKYSMKYYMVDLGLPSGTLWASQNVHNRAGEDLMGRIGCIWNGFGNKLLTIDQVQTYRWMADNEEQTGEPVYNMFAPSDDYLDILRGSSQHHRLPVNLDPTHYSGFIGNGSADIHLPTVRQAWELIQNTSQKTWRKGEKLFIRFTSNTYPDRYIDLPLPGVNSCLDDVDLGKGFACYALLSYYDDYPSEFVNTMTHVLTNIEKTDGSEDFQNHMFKIGFSGNHLFKCSNPDQNAASKQILGRYMWASLRLVKDGVQTLRTRSVEFTDNSIQHLNTYYIYSLRSGTFSQWKTLFHIDAFVKDSPHSLLQCGNHLYNLVINKRTADTLRKGYLLTRPYSFGDPFAMKVLKDVRLSYTKHKVNSTPSNDKETALTQSKCYIVVFASNDRHNWHRLTSLRSHSWKWYRFAVFTNLTDADSLSGMAVEYDVKRTGKLR